MIEKYIEIISYKFQINSCLIFNRPIFRVTIYLENLQSPSITFERISTTSDLNWINNAEIIYKEKK